MTRKSPIKDRTAFWTMLFAGTIFLLVGLFLTLIKIFIGTTEITSAFLIFASIFAGIITWVEIGIKRFTDVSNLKRFTTQQIVTFAISIVVILTSILVAIFPSVQFLTFFNSGLFAVEGIAIIVEAFR